jgi:NADH-quinone oxidoreductase subunit M
MSQVNIWLAVFGGLTIILGAYYMLKMFQNVMLGETNTTTFGDVTIYETLTMVVIIALLLFFGLYPKPINDLIHPSLNDIFFTINRLK